MIGRGRGGVPGPVADRCASRCWGIVIVMVMSVFCGRSRISVRRIIVGGVGGEEE